MNNTHALIISCTALYSTGHWIGATVLLVLAFCSAADD